MAFAFANHNGPGLAVFAALHPQRMPADPLPAVAAGIVTLFSFLLFLRTAKWSYRAE